MLRRTLSTSWLPGILAAAAVVVLLLRLQTPTDVLVRYVAYLVGCVGVPGVFTWRLLLRGMHTDEERRPTWFEDLSLGTIFGFGIQLPFFLVGVVIHLPQLVFALPAAVLVLSIATRWGRQTWTMPTDRIDPRASWPIAAIGVYGVVWLYRTVSHIQPLSLAPNQAMSTDELFHRALISDVGNRFPPEIPYLLGTRLDYHWFVHAQLATVESATGIAPEVMLRVVFPPVMLVLAIVGLASVALRLTGRPVAAVIAPALLVAGVFHFMGPDYNPYRTFEPYLSGRFLLSPSQSYGVMMSMPALMLVLEVLRPDRSPGRRTWLALVLALLALSGAKATFMPIWVCGAIGLWLVRLVTTRRIDRTVTALTMLLVAMAVFAQQVLFGGQSGNMAIDPLATVATALGNEGITVTSTSVAVMTSALLTSWLLYGAGVLGLFLKGRWLDPRAVWMILGIPAGIAVPLVMYRSGGSQLWFARSTAELVVLLSAWGMACLLPKPLTKRHALGFTATAAVAGLAVLGVSAYLAEQRSHPRAATMETLALTVAIPVAIIAASLLVWVALGRRRRQFGQSVIVLMLVCLLGLGTSNVAALGYDIVKHPDRPSPDRDQHFAPGGVPAAEYVKEHSSVDDIVATNMHCVRPKAKPCDNRHFWLAALSARRVVVEGWGYNALTNSQHVKGVSNSRLPVPFPERLEVNDAAFQQPSAETVGRLVEEYDVSWLFVSRDYAADVAGLNSLTDVLAKRYRNENYVVYEVIG